jgi:hypothetical protein
VGSVAAVGELIRIGHGHDVVGAGEAVPHLVLGIDPEIARGEGPAAPLVDTDACHRIVVLHGPALRRCVREAHGSVRDLGIVGPRLEVLGQIVEALAVEHAVGGTGVDRVSLVDAGIRRCGRHGGGAHGQRQNDGEGECAAERASAGLGRKHGGAFHASGVTSRR